MCKKVVYKKVYNISMDIPVCFLKKKCINIMDDVDFSNFVSLLKKGGWMALLSKNILTQKTQILRIGCPGGRDSGVAVAHCSSSV